MFDRSRDVANALLAQTIQEVSSQQPSEHSMACLDAALAQATSTDGDIIAQATQQRKAIKSKLKKLKNNGHKVARAIEALEAAMATRTDVEQLADAISRAELLESNEPNNGLSGALALAKVRLGDAVTEQRAAQKEAALDTAEHEFVALALSQPEVKNHTAEAPRRPEPDQIESTLCVVCISNPKTVLLLPGRHMCVCPECCESILQVEPLCPLCRANVDTHLEIFV